jgi:hypothetical protein
MFFCGGRSGVLESSPAAWNGALNTAMERGIRAGWLVVAVRTASSRMRVPSMLMR